MKTPHPIREFRLREKLSLQDLGDMVHRSKATISRIENGKQPVPQELLKSISEATGIPTAQLRPDLAELMDTE